MGDETLDTRKAFQPGSGYFGWMLIPDIKIVTGDGQMNQREKVLLAVTRLLEAAKALDEATAAVECRTIDKADAERELARVLHATYGDRSKDGVIYKGRRYYLDDEGQLAWQSMAAEVLV